MEYITYFKTQENTIRTYNYKTKEFKNIDSVKGLQCSNFELFKGFTATDEGLIEFSNKIKEWRDQIFNSKVLKCKFDYFEPFKMKNGEIYYRNHYNNVKRFFNIFANKKYENFEAIQLYEEKYFLKCQRGGLIYHQQGVYETAITYDFKGFYPSNMSSRDFHIPTTKGKIINIESIPKRY